MPKAVIRNLLSEFAGLEPLNQIDPRPNPEDVRPGIVGLLVDQWVEAIEPYIAIRRARGATLDDANAAAWGHNTSSLVWARDKATRAEIRQASQRIYDLCFPKGMPLGCQVLRKPPAAAVGVRPLGQRLASPRRVHLV